MGAAPKLPEQSESDFDPHREAMALLADDHDGPKHEDSEGVWLISYSDLMTLLMGFFALMLSMASFDSEEFANVADSAAEYFGGEVEMPFEKLGDEIQKLISEQGLQDQVQVVIKKTEIAVHFEGTILFDSGSIDLKNSAELIMNEIAVILKNNANGNYIFIEGHTDDNPIQQGLLASNWELSALRAGAVARLFERRGFARKDIMIVGFGETRALKPNRDSTGRPIQENQAANRRVVLKIMKQLPY